MTDRTRDGESRDRMDQYARSYIDKALEAQRRLGQSSAISPADYENAVRRVAVAFRDLAQLRLQRGRAS